MKRLFVMFVLICCAVMVQAQYVDQKEAKADGNRPLSEFVTLKKVLWNFDWEYSSGKEQKEWRHVDLPHDFQFEQPWTEDGSKARGFKPMCDGWYRKTFVADEAWKGLNVKLDFGGIIYYGDVYINGTKVASTDYGQVTVSAVSNKFKATYKTITK